MYLQKAMKLSYDIHAETIQRVVLVRLELWVLTRCRGRASKKYDLKSRVTD